MCRAGFQRSGRTKVVIAMRCVPWNSYMGRLPLLIAQYNCRPNTHIMAFSKLWILVIAVTMTGDVHGQTKTTKATVQWGPEMSNNKDGEFGSVFAHTDDAVYMSVFLKKERFIRKMDLRHRVVYQKVLPMEIDRDDHTMERTVLAGENILVFTSFFDKPTKQNNLFVRVYREKDMAPVGRIQKILTMDVEKKRNQGGFSVHTSPNDQRILVHQHLPFQKEGYERFEIKVYDMAMDLQWERQVELPYEDSEFAVEKFRVDDDGSVMMVGNKFAEKREGRALKREGKPDYTYHLLIYRGDGSQPEDHVLEVPGKFLQDIAVAVAREGDIMCGGFYGAKGSFTTSGAYYLRLDRATKQIVHSSFKEFDKDFITMYMTEKEEKKATKKAERKDEELEMYNYELREILIREDGGAVLMGEQYRYFETTTCTPNPNGGQTCRTTFHWVYNDIIAVNIDPNGDIEWAAKVPKRQHTVNDLGRASSYALMVKEDAIHVIFNDTGKNLFLKPGDKLQPYRPGKEALIVLATMSDGGHASREALLDVEKREAITLPKSAVQVGDDKLFIYADWKKTHRFGTITFK